MSKGDHLIRARILITTDYLVPGDHVDRLLRDHGCEPLHRPYSEPRGTEEQMTLLEGVDGAILASEPVTAEMLDAATDLKVIARSGVGYDSIDVAAATTRGVRVCNAPGTNHHSVAELTIGLMLTAARHLTEITAGVKEGRWPRRAGRELRGATLGVVGYGPSGRAVARLGAALGMTVLVDSSFPVEDKVAQFVDLDELIRESDYVSLHTRVHEANYHLFSASSFEAMKSTAVLINTARGALVDEHALAEALRSGAIAAAALDVLETEPLTQDSPLRDLDNVIITSHIAGQTREARMRAGTVAAQAIIDVFQGKEPAHPVEH